MNPSTERALERVLRKLERPPKRKRGWFSIAPIYLALGLVLAYQLLVRFVPAVWSGVLPGGLEQAQHLRGLPAVIWHLSRVCRLHFSNVALILSAIGAAGLLLSIVIRPLRFLVWLAAIAVILIDAGILIITVKAALDATLQATGVG